MTDMTQDDRDYWWASAIMLVFSEYAPQKPHFEESSTTISVTNEDYKETEDDRR